MRRRALALPLSAVLFFTLGCIAIIPGYDPNDPMKVTVTTVQSSIMPGGTLQLTVTVTGDGPLTVQWDVDGIQGGSSTVGTISATGLYTAPAAVTADLPLSLPPALRIHRYPRLSPFWSKHRQSLQLRWSAILLQF